MSVESLFDCLAPQCADHDCKSTFIAQAASMISLPCFGAMADMAQALVAAHMCTMYPEAGPVYPAGGGPVTSIREGDTAISFGFLQTLPPDDIWWHSSPYGQQFLSLRSMSACSGPFLARPS